MKKVVFFSLLIAISIWVLVYMAGQKEKIKIAQEKPTIVESQAEQGQSSLSSSSQSSFSKSAPDYRLRILSEPAEARIFIEGEEVGKSPMEIAIPSESKKLRLSLDSYDDYERQIPAAKDSEGDLVWKIQLKKKTQPKKSIKYYSKEIAPFSIQIKAVLLSEFTQNPETFGSIQNVVKLCRVNLKSAKSEKVWVRVVVGPFPTKAKAAESLKKIKVNYPDAFVATRHQCLGEN